jgi:hypothetical protein
MLRREPIVTGSCAFWRGPFVLRPAVTVKLTTIRLAGDQHAVTELKTGCAGIVIAKKDLDQPARGSAGVISSVRAWLRCR